MHRRLQVWVALLACIALFTVVGCGGSSSPVGSEELTAEKALRAALDGKSSEFVFLVAPSFLEEARREVPDIEDESLGGVLIAGFTEQLPFAGIKDALYRVEVQGEKAVVHVWGVFLDAQGGEMNITEAEAVRIPLIRENGQWYLDLLDL